MIDLHTERLARAQIALEGLSVGDALGEQFFMPPGMFDKYVTARRLPNAPWPYTDDTLMALSVFSILRQYQGIQQDALAHSFGHHYERGRGYGRAMHGVLAAYRQGANWREVAPSLFEGMGSFGNGSAMRIGPLGGYFADDLDALNGHARHSAEVTHAHPEAIAGAIAATVAGALAWQMRDTRPTPAEFLDHILPHVPSSEVRTRIERARALPPETTVSTAVNTLGNGGQVTCQDTVAFALWCAAAHLDDYEQAIWTTISGLGDIDTNCAIVGGIVALHTGMDAIPESWRANREPLPTWAFTDSDPL